MGMFLLSADFMCLTEITDKYNSLLVVMGLAMGGLLELMGPDVGCAFPIYTPE